MDDTEKSIREKALLRLSGIFGIPVADLHPGRRFGGDDLKVSFVSDFRRRAKSSPFFSRAIGSRSGREVSPCLPRKPVSREQDRRSRLVQSRNVCSAHRMRPVLTVLTSIGLACRLSQDGNEEPCNSAQEAESCDPRGGMTVRAFLDSI